jgi:hypothetical protein
MPAWKGAALVLKRFPCLLGVIVLALLVWAAFAPLTPAEAQEPETESVTTLLYPGWNMVGWVGRTTQAARIFEEIPELTEIRGWDTRDQRYRRSTRTSTGYRMSQITLGQGLWFHVESDAVVEWVRPVGDRYALLTLAPGLNLTGWAGRDAEPIETAFGRFGDALSFVWRWDAEEQRFDVYVPGGGAFNSLLTLNRGDALLVDVAGEVRWWQSGVGRTSLTHTGEVTPARQEDVRAALAEAIAFFAETHDIQPPEFSLQSGEGLPSQATTAFLGRPPGSRVVSSTVTVGSHVTGLSLDRILAHEYFHVLQRHWSQYPYPPDWLLEGSATYAAALYQVIQGSRNTDNILRGWDIAADRVATPLEELESDFYGVGERYYLSALAVDWLVQHASQGPDGDSGPATPASTSLSQQGRLDSLIEHYRLLRTLNNWQAAFEQAFHITPEAFYATFGPAREEAAFDRALRALFNVGVDEFAGDLEPFREAAAQPLPHTADDEVRPVVVVLGDVPTDIREDIQARLADVQTFFTNRLGAEPYEYSLFLAADEESARPARFGLYRQGWLGTAFYCSLRAGQLVFHVVSCGGELSDATLVTMPFQVLRSGTSGSRQPYWLTRGDAHYARAAFKAGTGATSYDEEFRLRTAAAHESSATLRQIATLEGWQTAGNSESLALSLLAVDWLVMHAGERSLLEYVRLLPRGDAGDDDHEPRAGSWEAAFEQAFGLTPDDFYDQFETYRATLPGP